MTTSVLPVRTSGLSDDQHTALQESLNVWNDNRYRNNLLSVYYDAEQPLKDLGISIPPALKGVKSALGWPQRAVTALARKHQFEGYSLGGDTDPFEAGEIIEANHFASELAQGISAGYKHGVSFLTYGIGDTSAGEPPVVIQAREAEAMAGVWDSRTRSLKHAVAIIDLDEFSSPTELRLYLRGETLQLVRERGVYRLVDNFGGVAGRVMADPLPYDPRPSKPFGRTRISKEVRYLTDAAIRTMVRAEVSAEFYASPQRYLLGGDEDAFAGTGRWTALLGRMLNIGTNEEGDKPTIGQFQQMTMTPHWEMYRQLAQNFCAATDLPMDRVGLFADNPSSAEAKQAAEATLAEEGEYQWRIFEPHLRRAHENVVMLRDNLSEPPAESWKMRVNWTPTRYVSPSSASNWAVQAVQADPSLQGSPIILRRLGMTQSEIEEHESWARRGQSRQIISQLLDGGDDGGPNDQQGRLPEATDGDEPSE